MGRLLALSALSALGCGGTSLTALDERALRNQQAAAAAIAVRAAALDAGAVEVLGEAVYCGAGGILRRAGRPTFDASVSCP